MLTRRDIIIKWSVYAAAALLLAFLFSLTLSGVRVHGVGLFLPPLIVGVVASAEDTRAATVFGLAAGIACDVTLAGTFPCVYTLAFTLSALTSSLLAKSVLQPGFLCSLAVTGLSFFYVDALNILALTLRAEGEVGAMLALAAQETVFSLTMLIVVHPFLMWVHRRFTL